MHQPELPNQESVIVPPPPPPRPQPYIYDDTSIRTIQIRDTQEIDAETAINVAIAHLGREVDDWELDDVDEPNDRTVILQFTQL